MNDTLIGPFLIRIYAPEGQRFVQTFEGLSRFLEAIPGVQVELDGSWFWVSHSPGTPWQIDGMIYDRLDAIEYVEIKGICSHSALRILFGAISGSANSQSTQIPDIVSSVNELDLWIRVHRVDQNCWVAPSELLKSDIGTT